MKILETGRLPAIERARAGDTLASLGDSRFDPERWYLPAEPNLGFIRIPAGKFIMGSDEYDRERPLHELDLPDDYWLAKYPVTVAQFRAFVEATKYNFDRWQFNPVANHPVVAVRWYDALAYCQWLDEQLSVISRQAPGNDPFWQGLAQGKLHVGLPSEAEWEKAARGTDGRIYPWGEKPDPNCANYDQTGIGDTSPVGAFPEGISPSGLLDLSGNVWEWTRSLWGKDYNLEFKYPYQPGEQSENLKAPDNVARVLRGGSFNNLADDARCASRTSVSTRTSGIRASVFVWWLFSPVLRADFSVLWLSPNSLICKKIGFRAKRGRVKFFRVISQRRWLCPTQPQFSRAPLIFSPGSCQLPAISRSPIATPLPAACWMRPLTCANSSRPPTIALGPSG